MVNYEFGANDDQKRIELLNFKKPSGTHERIRQYQTTNLPRPVRNLRIKSLHNGSHDWRRKQTSECIQKHWNCVDGNHLQNSVFDDKIIESWSVTRELGFGSVNHEY